MRAAALAPRSLEHALPDLVALAGKNTNQLRRYVRRTALRRIPQDVLLRNVAVALGNSGDARAIAPLVKLLAHRAPLVRGHAAWALGRFADPGARAALEQTLLGEPDAWVRDELTSAMRT